MKKEQFNALPNFSTSKNLNVDRKLNILKNVEIAKFGKNKNQTFFNNKFLDDLVSSGNSKKVGVKSRFGHPNICATSLGTYVGRFKKFRKSGTKVYADLYLDPITKKTQVEGKGITMYDYIMDMAENNPDMFGNSIVVLCRFFDEEIENEKGEPEVVTSLILDELVASDLVDDPAATDALFSSNPNDLGVVLTNFLDENPEIFKVIDKNPKMIEDFFARYENYSKRKRKPLINHNMSFLNNLMKKFSSKKSHSVDITLADGEVVTVVTADPERDEPAVGDTVVDSDGNNIADTELFLPDGRKIVTDEDGVITEILEEEGSDDDASVEEVANSVKRIEKKFDAFLKGYNKTQKENVQAFNVLANEINRVGKSVKTKYDVPVGKKTPRGGTPAGGYDPDKAREERNKRSTK